MISAMALMPMPHAREVDGSRIVVERERAGVHNGF
jgi:hypothetical protein